MSSVRTSSYRRVAADHFEPSDALDPIAAKRLRGQLEQIDYSAFAANREVIGKILDDVDVTKFQRLGAAAAMARARWVAEAMRLSEPARLMTAEETAKLTQLRASFEELTEAYEALRRMVERGYLPYRNVDAT